MCTVSFFSGLVVRYAISSAVNAFLASPSESVAKCTSASSSIFIFSSPSPLSLSCRVFSSTFTMSSVFKGLNSKI